MPASKTNRKPRHNYAFIDSQNLNRGIQSQGWKMDWKQFKSYLQSRFKVSKAFLFIGYLEEQEKMYAQLREMGYTLVFKPLVEAGSGEVKGNVDADLVLQTMIEYRNYQKAVIVTGDGDFHGLIKYLLEQDKLAALLIPNEHRYSSLYADLPKTKVRFLSTLRSKLAYRPTPKQAIPYSQ